MKVMAVGRLDTITPEQQRMHLPEEVPATLRLYLDGKIEQFWVRRDGKGVIFLMEVDSMPEAQALLAALPLSRAGIMEFEMIPVGPLSPLASLIE